jgi:hypothetical protein
MEPKLKVSHEKEKELRVLRYGPGVNEVSFCKRPHHNVHSTLGVSLDINWVLKYLTNQ